MQLIYPTLVYVLLLFIAQFPSSLNAGLFSGEWEEIPQEELDMESPKLDPDAEAEILYNGIKIDDTEDDFCRYDYHKRFKVFTESGVGKLTKQEIVYYDSSSVYDVAGRVIKADGTIVELDLSEIKKKAVYEKDNRKFRSKSFSVPGLEVGSILEYKWSIKRMNDSVHGDYILLQEEWPTHHANVYFRQYVRSGFKWQTNGFRVDEFKKIGSGKYELNLYDLAALPDYDYMMPKYNRQKWIMIRYSYKVSKKNLSWSDLAKDLDYIEKRYDSRLGNIRKKAKNLTKDLSSIEEKVRAIYYFCKDEIQNTTYGYHDMSVEEFKDRKRNENLYDTFTKGYGTRWDINMLFYNMLCQLGIEAKVCVVSDRSNYFMNKSNYDIQSMNSYLVWVNLGDKPVYCDPGRPMLPFGQLYWVNEGLDVLFSDKKKARFEKTPFSNADFTLISRTADLSLDEEGNLVGKITKSYTGHFRVKYQMLWDELTNKERIKKAEKNILAQFPSAEISNCKVNNVYKSMDPFTISYDIKIPYYGQKTGKRLFFKTCYFEYGKEKLFTEEKRDMPIYFRLGKLYKDEVNITLPEGFEFEKASAPSSLLDTKMLAYKVSIQMNPKERKITYRREYREEAGVLPVKTYPSIRQIFHAIFLQDQHELVLKKLKK